MTKTRTLRAKNPGDLLAVVPPLLGFHPADSLVVLTVGGGTDRFHARVDLPHDDSEIPQVVASLSDAAERNRIGQVVVVVYSDDKCLSLEVFSALRSALEGKHVTVLEAIRWDGERWYSLTGCTERCCPEEGTACDVRSHPLTAQSVLDGQVVLGSRQELADSLIGTDLEAIASVEESADRAMTRLQAATRHPLGPPTPQQARVHLVGEGQWVRERVCRFLRDEVRLDAEDTGRILVAMIAIDVRDVAWAEMSRSNAAAHVQLWRNLLQRAPYDLMAAPAGLLGFAAWLSGDGALAWCAVARCQEAEPDYRLADLLSSALDNAVPPSVWKPINRADLTLFAS
ncbi:MAG TPA: DUF4192 domain-containing protein [Nocardioidaceae bacterium]|nr:DUF4192 domain-containing protein [Nocardioidaceae bacterium]